MSARAALMRRLLSLTGVPRWRVALTVVLGALTVLFGVGLMASAGYLISRAAERPAVLSLEGVIVAVRFFGIGRPLLRYMERLASHDLALGALGRVRVHAYERIEPLAPAQLEGYRDGDLLSRMVADVDALQNLHLRGILPPLVALAAGALAAGAAAAFLPAAGLILALGLLVGGLAVPGVAGACARRASRRRALARGALSAEVLELLDSAPELAAYGQAQERLAAVQRADRTLVSCSRGEALAVGLGDGVGLLITGVTTACVLAAAVTAHAGGRLNAVLLALLALLTIAAFDAIQPLAAASRELLVTLGAGRRVLEVIDREPAIHDPVEPLPAPSQFTVALEHVAARYGPGEQPALRDVTLRLEPGCRVALIGPSGAGKTTIVNLLLRFLDPESGRVSIGGRELSEYAQDDVRCAISVAGQDSHLFSTSIRENVRLARPDARSEELEQALRAARIWSWIESLPDGLDTLVGEEGRELSGGQRQRIVLARALLAGAPVLVLDEPTAHLDPQTAGELVRDVFDAAGGRSVLLITHRPEGLELVDEIVTLHAGRTVGRGDWEQLTEREREDEHANGDDLLASLSKGAIAV
jgi:thiol reductant ABC exporter CydC subunit